MNSHAKALSEAAQGVNTQLSILGMVCRRSNICDFFEAVGNWR